MSIYFDPTRNLYVDTETGTIIPADETDILANETKSAINTKDTIDADHAFALSLSDMEHGDLSMSSPTRTIDSPVKHSFFGNIINRLKSGDYAFRSKFSSDSINYTQTQPTEMELAGMGGAGTEGTGVGRAGGGGGAHDDDWFLARALQMMEFEMQEDLNAGLPRSQSEIDFNAKEVKASSCYTQMMTISTAIVLCQIGVLIAEIQIYGYAPRAINPLIGPDAQALVNFGAKEAGLIVQRGQWWRCVTSIFVHAGILHLLSNGAIQLRVGGYLNQVYGNITWFLIYFVSGFFGNMMSCIYSQDSISVGSSGAVLGMLSSWIVWILFRWNRIPERARGNRNCQLVVVLACVGITLGTSFSNYIDWAAHYGGASMGTLWGFLLISKELENPRTKIFVRIASIASIAGYMAWAFYEMLDVIDPPIVLEPN